MAAPAAEVATPLYSGDQLTVPAALPDVLKAYSKAVIRANPADVTTWSAE